jgi:hypothetical protein
MSQNILSLLNKPQPVVDYTQYEFLELCKLLGDLVLHIANFKTAQKPLDNAQLMVDCIILNSLELRFQKKRLTLLNSPRVIVKKGKLKFKFKHEEALVFIMVFSFPNVLKAMTKEPFHSYLVDFTMQKLQQKYA